MKEKFNIGDLVLDAHAQIIGMVVAKTKVTVTTGCTYDIEWYDKIGNTFSFYTVKETNGFRSDFIKKFGNW